MRSEIDEELNLHLDLRTEELRARGLPADAARREALLEFGDLEGTRAYCRQQDHDKESHMQRALMIEELAQDLRIGLRGLIRAPIMTLTIVATVGLGIGATTAIFAAIHAALLRPLPYANPSRLVRIYTDAPPNRFPFSVADYLALTAQQTRFEQIAGYATRAMTFTDGSAAERLKGKAVSWTYFGLLGLRPISGRDFTESDGRPGNPSAAIVSDAFWRSRLAARSDAIGKPIRLDGVDYTVVGRLPPTAGPLERDVDFFVAAQWSEPPRKGPFFITVLGRLRSETDRSAAADELRAINRRIFPVWRVSYQDERATWSSMDLKAYVAGDAGPIAGLALAAVALVWLIACANASNLLIARITSRRRELAVRAALGASRGRVVRYLLAESGLLALGAAAVGAALARVGVGLLRNLGAGYLPRMQEVSLDATTLWVLAASTAASVLLFGAIPAMHGSGGALDASLRASGRSSTGTVSVGRLRRALVGGQFAIATPLLVIAGLLIVSLNALSRVDLGFNTHNLLSGALVLPATQYGDEGTVRSFWDQLQQRVAALPGVTGVTFADGRPPNDVQNFNNFDLEDAPTPSGQSEPVTPWVSVTPDYFGVIGLSLQQGRLLDARDALAANIEAVVVDRAWARRFFPNTNALGRRLKQGGCSTCPWTTVVGIVNEVRYAGLDKPEEGTVFWAMAPGNHARYLIVRTSTDAATVLPSVRQVVHELDPTVPLSTAATMEEQIDQSLQRPRSVSALVAVFAAVALILSIVGVYGVMAYYVQQHAKDISIRLALGGNPRNVLRRLIGEGMKVVTSGVAAGLLTAIIVTRLTSSLLFGVSPGDARTLAAVGVLLLAAALLACAIPATRAVQVEPAAVLREE